MKRIIYLVICLIPFNVFAAGTFNLSVSSVTMYPGDTKTITISSDNVVGKLNVTSSSSNASVNASSVFLQNPGGSTDFVITANSVGSAVISVVGTNNLSTMDEEILEGVTKTINVNVIEKKVVIPEEPETTKTTTTTTTRATTRATTKATTTTTTKANINTKTTTSVVRTDNTNITSLEIEGYILNKVDEDNYSLTVNNNVTSVNVKASLEDSHSSITGLGLVNLNVGDNNITLTITSEVNRIRRINIIVNRKDGIYLEDLSDAVKSKDEVINVIIKKDSVLTKDMLEIIKSSGKIFNFNYYDENKTLIYSWMIDGDKVNAKNELALGINRITDTKKIYEASNYSDGLYISFNHEGELFDGTLIKVLVNDKYSDEDILNLYYFDEDKLILTESDIVVKGGYAEINLDHCSSYFLTKAVLDKENNSSVSLVIAICEFVIILGGIGYFLYKKFYKKKKEDTADEFEKFTLTSNLTELHNINEDNDENT